MEQGNEIVVIELDDWKALYVNGKCFEQHHHVDIGEAINAHPPIISYACHWVSDKYQDQVQEYGEHLPDRLDEYEPWMCPALFEEKA